MHRLAAHLDLRLEFVPYGNDTVIEQLESGEVDLVVGGLMVKPERLMRAGFTQPYQTATIAVVLPDHRRGEFNTWNDPDMPSNLRVAVPYADLVVPAQRHLPGAEIVVIESVRSYFAKPDAQLDGLIMQAEEAAVWNVLYPEHAVVVPEPVIQRPVGMAVRLGDLEWLLTMNRWLDFEQFDGSLDRLRSYWIEGGGTKKRNARWCIIRDVLHWVP